MISILLYGRNDSYGYNLHKRVALSLNTMAEVLTNNDDEILFVDYNTPDDFPTLPEAIADTLTDRAKKYLRILRVRNDAHQRFTHLTHLKALEPISRNVALRRSNPNNRWILSSNTDMIFVPRSDQSLSDICRSLPNGHYGIPRMEVPETLWEQLDRKEPKNVINTLSDYAWKYHLNECVYGELPHMFDAPGDFQLMLREDLFAIDGFDERMLIGWHVDSNIAKRLSFLRGEVTPLTDQLFGYHCDHTRQVTPMHKAGSTQNSIAEFITEVDQAYLPDQRDIWGLNDLEIEEICLADQRNSYLEVLDSTLASPQVEMTTSYYRNGCYDINQKGTAEHIIPFLYDLFSSRKRDTQLLWVGEQNELFSMFSNALQRGGFNHEPLFLSIQDAQNAVIPTYDSIVIDFDFDTPQPHVEQTEDNSGLYMNFFIEECLRERHRLDKDEKPRQFIGINTVANRYETLFLRYIGAAKTPFNIRLRHGFLLQDAFQELFSNNHISQDWTPLLHIGGAGVRKFENNLISTKPHTPGHVCFGPYEFLPIANYTAKITIRGRKLRKAIRNLSIDQLSAEVVSGDTWLGRAVFNAINSHVAEATIEFHSLPEDIPVVDRLNGIQVRICTTGNVQFEISQVLVSRS